MRIRFKFSLGVMLVGVAMIGGFLAGSMRGYQLGYQKWGELRVWTQAYYLGDIVTMQTKLEELKLADELFDDLVADIKKHVSPHVWDYDPHSDLKVLGDFQIQVTGNAAVHDEIDEFCYCKRLDVTAQVLAYNRQKLAANMAEGNQAGTEKQGQ
jgi:hypothetical protein